MNKFSGTKSPPSGTGFHKRVFSSRITIICKQFILVSAAARVSSKPFTLRPHLNLTSNKELYHEKAIFLSPMALCLLAVRHRLLTTTVRQHSPDLTSSKKMHHLKNYGISFVIIPLLYNGATYAAYLCCDTFWSKPHHASFRGA